MITYVSICDEQFRDQNHMEAQKFATQEVVQWCGTISAFIYLYAYTSICQQMHIRMYRYMYCIHICVCVYMFHV
jgi:hypothetical protein